MIAARSPGRAEQGVVQRMYYSCSQENMDVVYEVFRNVYIQHNSMVPAGVEGCWGCWPPPVRQEGPPPIFTVKHIPGPRDLVVVHSLLRPEPADETAGTAYIDLFRT